MQKKYWGIIVAIYLLNNCVFGQSLQDTVIYLDEIQVIAKKDKYLVGSKIEKIDSVKLESVSSESLAGIINNYLPIYVRQDAGGLATISFRGTSPDHTAIMFNGININSLTLGHTNISSVPAFLFDDIKVQFGSSSSLYGTDAIGGSIQLGNNPKWNKGFAIALQQDMGSFHSYFSGLKISYSNEKFIYSIKGYREKKKNDFPFLNTAVRDFEKDEFVTDTSKNTAIANYGFLQEMAYRFSTNLHAFVNIWYEDNWHQIQPNMSTNYYGGDLDEIKNNHLRIVSGINYYLGAHKLTTNLGYIYDYQIYNKNNDQIISTNRFNANVDYFNTDLFKGDLNIGFNYLHIKPEVYAFDDSNEDRIEAFLAYKKAFFKRLTGSLNIRETVVLDYENQFTPSIGFNYLFISTKSQVLDGKLSVSKSYKIPTFNDRFWINAEGVLLGDPNLLPEDGMSYELGASYELKKQSNRIKIGLTGFYLDVDNWIQWVPVTGNDWIPKNNDKVQSKGIEFNFETAHKISNIELNSGIQYSLNKVILVKNYSNPNSQDIGKQLLYTPEHIGKIFLSVNYNKWVLLMTGAYTGQSYLEHKSDGSSKLLEDYFLLNSSFGKTIQLKDHKFVLNFKVNNILNKAYQSKKLYAMPGRNYKISIKYSLNKPKSNEKN